MHRIARRAVARSENPWGLVVLGGENVPPLVEIGLTDLPKTVGGEPEPPSPPACDSPGSYKLCSTRKSPTEIKVVKILVEFSDLR